VSELASYTKFFADAQNVRMKNVLPGRIDSSPATEERRQSAPMGRYGTSDVVAAPMAFLVWKVAPTSRPEHQRGRRDYQGRLTAAVRNNLG